MPQIELSDVEVELLYQAAQTALRRERGRATQIAISSNTPEIDERHSQAAKSELTAVIAKLQELRVRKGR